MSDEKKKGLLIVYTGDGKGKTTAAFGMVVRAVGYNWKIYIIQFIKGNWRCGEQDGLKKLSPNVELEVIGEGFVGILDDKKSFEVHRQAAQKALKTIEEKLTGQEYNLIILDELNVALTLGLITREETENILDKKPDSLHLVTTGRGAPQWLIDRADLVTEMKEIKHPYKKGIKAQKGIDF